MTAMFQFNVISGILIAYISNYLLRDAGQSHGDGCLEWQEYLRYFLILLFIIPESPRYLIKMGEVIKARIILEKIEVSSIDKEIREIESSLSQSSVKSRLFSHIYILNLFQ